MEQIINFGQYLLSALHSFGAWAYPLTFSVALIDSVIIIGPFAPGSTFLFLTGVLISQGIYEPAYMLMAGASGAIIGGFINYHLGKVGTGMLVQRAQEKEGKQIDRGQSIIDRYGGVGVFFGRFLGPLGSIIAFTAGVTGMKYSSFIFWNILTGATWAASFIFLGMFFGDHVQVLEWFF